MTEYGLQLPNFALGVETDGLFQRVADMAVAAEEAGFSSIWVMDHFHQLPPLGGPSQPMLEAYTLLGALAARTSRMQLGALVTGVTYRNPAVLAKQVTTLDVISGGRAILGIGAAWYEEEHVAFGVDYPPVGERMDRLEEAVRICRAMFTEDAPTFEGRYYRVHNAVNVPQPLRPGGPPIMIGGDGPKRTLRAVAAHADMCNLHGGPERLRRSQEVIERHCADVGRDPSAIKVTRLGSLFPTDSKEEAAQLRSTMESIVGVEQANEGMTIGTPEGIAEHVQELAAAGVDELIFNLPTARTPEEVAAAGATLSAALS